MKVRSLILMVFSSMLFCQCPVAATPSSLNASDWLRQQLTFDIAKILENTSPVDAKKGAVIAAKTRENPNYYYHWVRDAGITMNTLASLYPTLQPIQQAKLLQSFFDYVNFSTELQHTTALTGLGEPKFELNGQPYNGPWARPQNDSPAMRAISMIHWANQLMDEGRIKEVNTLFDTSDSPIRIDLDYVLSNWQQPSYDLWEEVKGMHFYTLMVERRALIDGAKLASRLQHEKLAIAYQHAADEMTKLLATFWDAKRQYIVATQDRVAGLDYKQSNLDIAVILGLLHGETTHPIMEWDDPRVLATMNALTKAFKHIYPINQDETIPGVAIGRYPEDKYAGDNFNGGNPWVLTTLAIAEAYYRIGDTLIAKHQLKLANEMMKKGDQFVNRVRYHANQDGSLNEQIDRRTGKMTSVRDLTWNYAALLSARGALLLNH